MSFALEGTSATARNVTLLELLDRIVDCGVVLTGDLTISVADVDLISLGLKMILASAERMEQLQAVPNGAALEAPNRSAAALETPGREAAQE